MYLERSKNYDLIYLQKPEPKEITTEPVTPEEQLKQEPKQDEPIINNEVEAEKTPIEKLTNQKLSSKAAIYESDLACPVTPPPVKVAKFDFLK